jgi:arsenite methyltransferase
MVPLPKVIWYETTATQRPPRQPEPLATMDDAEQVRAYVKAYEWGGPTSALQLHHLRELSRLIRPGDTVVDLACGPGPLMLELAAVLRNSVFVGVDLSGTMLQHLRQEAIARGLDNISVLQEDIRTLPSLKTGQVDLVISTSALHHLADAGSLRDVFRRISSLLKPGGGFYIFDFGLLKSSGARKLFVAEVAKLAPPITARDYDVSLKAAFPIEVVLGIAKDELPRPYNVARSAFVDFFYFLQTPPRAECSEQVRAYIDKVWRRLPHSMKIEHGMLRSLRRKRFVR